MAFLEKLEKRHARRKISTFGKNKTRRKKSSCVRCRRIKTFKYKDFSSTKLISFSKIRVIILCRPGAEKKFSTKRNFSITLR